MPQLKDYAIEYDDGTVQHRQLNADDAKELKDLADDKGSTIKSVKQGSAEPINKD